MAVLYDELRQTLCSSSGYASLVQSLSRGVTCLVPVFIQETRNKTNYCGSPKLVQTGNASLV